MFIDGFGLTLFRSFGDEIQYLGPFSNINFFVGQNNSGKSNILRFIRDHFAKLVDVTAQGSTYAYTDFDRRIGDNSGNRYFVLPMQIDGERYKALVKTAPQLEPLFRKLLASSLLGSDLDVGWIAYVATTDNQHFELAGEMRRPFEQQSVLSVEEWGLLWTFFNNGRTSQDFQNVILPETLNSIAHFEQKITNVELIGATRRIAPRESDMDGFDGMGIIDRLSRLQHPPFEELYRKKKFAEINSFLKNVTGKNSAQIEIPEDKRHILVEIDGLTLPIEDLGTGIHEVVILAAACTVIENQVVCIEEPELHLHPILQRKLVRYLQHRTNNQYFFTTHSAHLLDTPNSTICHVRYQDGSTTIERVSSSARRSSICADLGYFASDLLQSNCIIWVEGPSDRVYLNHWIKSADPKLEEGIHYSIMFYGGRLLSHLSAEDPQVTDFLSLRALNRYISVIIDSDRASNKSDLNATKKRIQQEFDKGPGFAWVTAGREIENYIPHNDLLDAVKKVHPSASELAGKGRFAHSLYFKTVSGKLTDTNIDKVEIAHEVARGKADLSVLDLNEMVNKVVDFIKESNDADPYFLD